jgi:HAD superfamily hydrolase (TIGR01509 family)
VPLETVFLDAGGVLLYPNWTRISDTLRSHGVEIAPAALAAAELPAKHRLDTGGTIQATNDDSRGWLYFNLILEQAGVPLSPGTDAALRELRAYHSATNLWEHVPAHVRPALDALNARGLRVVVVSNANGTLRAHMRRLGLDARFHTVLDSHDHGVEKPDPRFFQVALEASGASPATTIHVGDLYHVDVVGARSAGLRGVLLDEGGLYPDADCPRVRTLSELVEQVRAGRFD